MIHAEEQSTRRPSYKKLGLIAVLIGLGSAILLKQMPWKSSMGIKFISTGTSPLNMAFLSKIRSTGDTHRQFYSGYGNALGPAIPVQDFDKAMSNYGVDRNYRYYPGMDHYHDSPAYRYQDQRYSGYGYGSGDRYSGYGYRSGRHYGDELTFSSKGEAHLASYRFAPGGYGGGHYDRYGGGHYDRYGGGYSGGYGYNDRYGSRYRYR
jgi:hypothetical protein